MFVQSTALETETAPLLSKTVAGLLSVQYNNGKDEEDFLPVIRGLGPLTPGIVCCAAAPLHAQVPSGPVCISRGAMGLKEVVQRPIAWQLLRG